MAASLHPAAKLSFRPLNAAEKLQPQRNYALTKITNPNTLLYYLDDDNILHPNLYKWLDNIDSDNYQLDILIQ
jgi:hypothetical protein